MVGWDNREHWHHSIAFHAQLIDSKVFIEADMTEDLTESLLEAGIPKEDVVWGNKRDRLEAAQAETTRAAA